jgi:hypothetical protein
MKKNYLSLLLLVFYLYVPVNARENAEIIPSGDEGKILTPDSMFIINSFKFNINGFTRQDALIYKGGLKKGEIIQGIDNLEKYTSDKAQRLYNERALESVTINYTVTGEENGMTLIELEINVKDTWNIVALPYPKYSSSTGFDFILKARDYNFLGTLTPIRIDIGYKYNEERRSTFLLELDSNIPFHALGYDWNIKFQNYFNYRPDVEEQYYYRNITGISIELPVKSTILSVSLDESFIYNDENSYSDKLLYGSNFQHGGYFSSNPYISWKIPLIQDLAGYGPLNYTPGISAIFNHEIGIWRLNDNRIGPFLNMGHVLGFGKIDWIGNFRKGYAASFNNYYDFNFYNAVNDFFTINMELSVTGHFIISDFFGISSRFMYRRWFLSQYGNREAGNALRGILDRDISTDSMISLNLDFPFRILKFKPSEWISPKLHIFDFDFHLSPIVDLAFCNKIMDENSGYNSSFLITSGLEAIIFPDFFRSLYVRVSLGLNLRDIKNIGKYEIFFGIGHHF